MATDTSKITGAADDLADKLTKGGSAAKSLGAEIASAFASLDARVAVLEQGDTTQPPIEPPPSSNTKGKITNFNNGQTYKLDGADVVSDNPAESWSLRQVDDYAVRYEVRQGDHWGNETGNNRNENRYSNGGAIVTFPEGRQVTMEMTVTIEPGPVNTAGFCSLVQAHASVNSPPAPFYFNLDKGDYLAVIIQNPSTQWKNVGKTTQPLVRGRAYNLRAEVLMKPGGSGGYARVWLDDVQLANYSGSIGANNSTYFWKWGIYREANSNTLSVVYRNIVMSNG